MKIERKSQLFEGYVRFWLVKLNLHKKFTVNITIDRRLKTKYAEATQHSPKEYTIAFNPSNLKSDNIILHTVLHELGHFFHKWQGVNSEQEYLAEIWALKMAKEHYPKQYRRMVNRTIKEVKLGQNSPEYTYGYLKALKELGEWTDV